MDYVAQNIKIGDIYELYLFLNQNEKLQFLRPKITDMMNDLKTKKIFYVSSVFILSMEQITKLTLQEWIITITTLCDPTSFNQDQGTSRLGEITKDFFALGEVSPEQFAKYTYKEIIEKSKRPSFVKKTNPVKSFIKFIMFPITCVLGIVIGAVGGAVYGAYYGLTTAIKFTFGK
jgi:hypothetical protein